MGLGRLIYDGYMSNKCYGTLVKPALYDNYGQNQSYDAMGLCQNSFFFLGGGHVVSLASQKQHRSSKTATGSGLRETKLHRRLGGSKTGSRSPKMVELITPFPALLLFVFVFHWFLMLSLFC